MNKPWLFLRAGRGASELQSSGSVTYAPRALDSLYQVVKLMSRSSSPPRVRSLIRFLIPAAALACAATLTAPAQAAPSFTLDRATIGGGLRFGSEDLNLGLGVRGGYTFGQGIYVGGLIDYWFGEDDEDDAFGFARVETSYSAWDFFGVIGYDAGITPSITIRPFGGFGFVHVEWEQCGGALGLQGCRDDDETDPGAILGGEVLFEIGTSLHVGPELRIMIFEDTAVAIGGNIGGTF